MTIGAIIFTVAVTSLTFWLVRDLATAHKVSNTAAAPAVFINGVRAWFSG
jgi:hypothetical protein